MSHLARTDKRNPLSGIQISRTPNIKYMRIVRALLQPFRIERIIRCQNPYAVFGHKLQFSIGRGMILPPAQTSRHGRTNPCTFDELLFGRRKDPFGRSEAFKQMDGRPRPHLRMHRKRYVIDYHFSLLFRSDTHLSRKRIDFSFFAIFPDPHRLNLHEPVRIKLQTNSLRNPLHKVPFPAPYPNT